MALHKWLYTDPQTSSTYEFPRNPEKMTSPVLDRAITAQGTLGGGFATWEGQAVAKQMTFTGRVLNKAHYDALVAWHKKQNRFTITDHFGRVMTVVPLSSDLVPDTKRTSYWNHEYTITVLVLACTAGTVGDIWS